MNNESRSLGPNPLSMLSVLDGAAICKRCVLQEVWRKVDQLCFLTKSKSSKQKATNQLTKIMKLILSLIVALISSASAANLRQRRNLGAYNVNRVYQVIGGYVRFTGKCSHLEDLTLTDGIVREHFKLKYNPGQETVDLDLSTRWQNVKATGDDSGDKYFITRRDSEEEDYSLAYSDDDIMIFGMTSWSYSYAAKVTRQSDGVVYYGTIEVGETLNYDVDTDTFTVTGQHVSYNIDCPP